MILKLPRPNQHNPTLMKTSLSLALLLLALLPIREAVAVPCVLLTRSNEIITLDSNTPGTTSGAIPVTGLGAFELVGIDVRTTVQTVGGANPGKGTVWGFAVDGTSSNGRVFVINTTTGAATAITAVLPGFTLGSGTNAWVFAHNPGTDRFRLMNFTSNYEFNPNTGTLSTQTDLQDFPNSNGSAFETASFGQNPAIFFVDQAMNDSLFTSATIQNGNYSPVGETGLSFGSGVGLDIFGPLMLLAADDAGTARLYSVNRTTGAATVIGAIGGNPMIRALTILPTTLPPTLKVTCKVKGPKRIATTSPSVTIRGTAKSLAGIKRVDYKVGKGKSRKARGKNRWSANVKVKPGTNVVLFRATGNNLIRSKPAKVTIVRQ